MDVLPYLVIAAGAGIGVLGWLYGRVAAREREVRLGLARFAEEQERWGSQLEREAKAAAENAQAAEARIEPVVQALSAWRRGEADRERAAAGLATRVGTIEADLGTALARTEEAHRRIDLEEAKPAPPVPKTPAWDPAPLLDRLARLERQVGDMRVARVERHEARPAPFAPATPPPLPVPVPVPVPVPPRAAPSKLEALRTEPPQVEPPQVEAPQVEPTPPSQGVDDDREAPSHWIFIALAVLLLLALLAHTLGGH